MSLRTRLFRALTPILFVLGASRLAFADPVQVVASDEHGATLRLTVPEWRLELSNDPEGLSSIRIAGLRTLSEPGRPELPYESALLAVPPGATITARLVDNGAEETRDGVHLVVGDKPTFHNDRNGLGFVPAREPVEPIVDGLWPSASVDVGKPFVVRGQRMVAVSLRPFRYDARERRLYSRRTLTVRIEFRGATAPALRAASDRHWEPVLQASLLNYAQGRAWRIAREAQATPLFPRGRTGTTSVTGGGPFDESFPEVRVKLDTTGVYALTFNQLVAANPQFPSLPIAQVSIHRHEFIEGATPPYVTAELPIEVDDVNGNNTFDAGDRIVVFVQNWYERTHVSQPQRMWGDAEVVYATYVSGAGQRVTTRAGWRNQVGLTPLASYPWSQRWERNFTYATTPSDTLQDTFHWTEGIQLYYDRPDSFRFETNHLDPSHTARVDVTWQGRANNPHYNWASVTNGGGLISIVADSIAWFGQSAQTGGATIPGTALTEGLTNGVAIWGENGSGRAEPELVREHRAQLLRCDVLAKLPCPEQLSAVATAATARARYRCARSVHRLRHSRLRRDRPRDPDAPHARPVAHPARARQHVRSRVPGSDRRHATPIRRDLVASLAARVEVLRRHAAEPHESRGRRLPAGRARGVPVRGDAARHAAFAEHDRERRVRRSSVRRVQRWAPLVVCDQALREVRARSLERSFRAAGRRRQGRPAELPRRRAA
jgi:hypothetical protein